MTATLWWGVGVVSGLLLVFVILVASAVVASTCEEIERYWRNK